MLSQRQKILHYRLCSSKTTLTVSAHNTNDVNNESCALLFTSALPKFLGSESWEASATVLAFLPTCSFGRFIQVNLSNAHTQNSAYWTTMAVDLGWALGGHTCASAGRVRTDRPTDRDRTFIPDSHHRRRHPRPRQSPCCGSCPSSLSFFSACSWSSCAPQLYAVSPPPSFAPPPEWLPLELVPFAYIFCLESGLVRASMQYVSPKMRTFYVFTRLLYKSNQRIRSVPSRVAVADEAWERLGGFPLSLFPSQIPCKLDNLEG